MEGTPLVLLIEDKEWTARSLESILRPEGYAVLRAYTGSQGLELASKIRPSTPILVFNSGALTRQDELDGFRAGVWGMISSPFNPQELLARLVPLIAAKRDMDAALESSFV